MARKSNKTAHVLNLLSGQDTNEEPEKEPEKSKESKSKIAVEADKVEAETTVKTDKPEAEAAPVPVKPQPAPPEVPSNISIIDSGAKEADPIAERIHEELLKELEQEQESLPEEVKASEPPIAEKLKAEPVVPAVEESKEETLVVPAAEEPKKETSTIPITEEPKEEASTVPIADEAEVKTPEIKEPKIETPPSPVAEAPAKAPAPQKEPEEEVLEISPEPPADPEPDYVMLNVMQRVVEDKIIYFMKQFEVCTCDRCKADTIALTLSGLPAKYRIVDKHAVDPLVSYYTSRLISQVTVEALKACTQVKENPRH